MNNTNNTPIRIASSFGHEIFATVIARNMSVPVFIIPNKDDCEEYYREAERILGVMSFFYTNMLIVPFEKRNDVICRDVIAELKAGQFKDWDLFFRNCGLQKPRFPQNLPQFSGLAGERPNILFVPQKLVSDGACGKTAEQQSLQPELFSFLKDEEFQLVLGQHFNKVNDLEAVLKLKEEFGLYVPGLDEDKEVFGIRGIAHEQYYNMYAQLDASIGIAGTHTWIMLAMFPDVPQVILYRKGIEDWEAIARAARYAGRRVYALGFDDETNMDEFRRQMEELFYIM